LKLDGCLMENGAERLAHLPLGGSPRRQGLEMARDLSLDWQPSGGRTRFTANT
jgi:hypothetical protein